MASVQGDSAALQALRWPRANAAFRIQRRESQGLDPKVLTETFSKYNESVRMKKDPFGEKVCLDSPPQFHVPCYEKRQLTPPFRSSSQKANG